MKQVYNKVIIIGSGKMAFCCAKIVKEESNVDIFVFSYKAQMESGLQMLCEKNKIEYKAYNDAKLLECELIALKGKILIISAFNIYIFPEELIRKRNVTIINYHPALLPKHPGRNAEAWAIFEQDKVTGITWHKVTKKIDNGEILIQRKIPLDEGITSLKLMIIQQKVAIEAFKKIIKKLLTDTMSAYEQEKTNTKVHYARQVPNNGILDTEWDIQKISAFLRAMDYGKLRILGTPIVMIEKKSYTWDSYNIIAEEEENVDVDNSICIKKGQSILLLRGIHRYERRN